MENKNSKNANINKFFNKLYVSYPNLKNIDKSYDLVNNQDVANYKKINYVYTTENSDKWFVKQEKDNQEIFFFGQIKEGIPQQTSFILKFDNQSLYSKDCNGIINTKNVYVNTEYFINNYPTFKTKLNETTIDVFINGVPHNINVIKLGEYVENIEQLLTNLNTLLNELDDYKNAKLEKINKINEKTSKENIEITLNEKSCEICGKKLKRHEKKLCKKCSRKKHAGNILIKLLKHVEPQTPFKKDDLNKVFSSDNEINDCIWSLEDFNLIKHENNEYFLVEKTTLNKFINKYSSLEDNSTKETIKKEEPKKLNKTCAICKKTLSKSKFYKSKKTKDGLEDYCKNCKRYVNTANYLNELTQEIIPGSKFKVTDLNNNFENPIELIGRLWELQDFDLLTYDTNEDTYILKDLNTCQNFLEKYYISDSITIKPKLKKDEKVNELTKEEQMNIVIDSILDGKTEKEAAELAGINLYKITHWFNEGKNNTGKENISFYRRYSEAKKQSEINSIQNFYTLESFNNKTDLTIADTLRKQQMENVLKEIGSGSSMKTAAFNSSITYETLQYWYKRGKQNFGEEYNEFYEKINILQSPIETPKPKEQIIKKQNDIPEIEKNLPDLYKPILNPLPHKIKKLFRGVKESESGFAWVKKDRNSWRYDRQRKDNRQIITRKNIYELYLAVQEHGYLWGVRNLKKAKETLIQSKLPVTENNGSFQMEELPKLYQHILDPLPFEIKKLFVGAKESESGFAWVKKDRNSWRYDRQQKENRQSISKKTIYELYLAVKEKNYIWGVRNLEKAKETLKQSNVPIVNEEFKKDDKFEHILDPLPEKYSKRFKKPSSSGLSWVTKINNTWGYINPTDNVRIYDINIYNLYLKVKDKNLPWGVRDLQKAKESLAQCEKPDITNEINENIPKSANITCTYFSNKDITKIIINGSINDNELFNMINYFKEFEKNTIRIITTRHSNYTEVFMEFNLKKSDLNEFKKIVEKFNVETIKENKKNITKNSDSVDEYNEKHLLKEKSDNTINLYYDLKNNLLSKYENIDLIAKNTYWVFKINNKVIASIIPFNEYLKTYINSDNINDYKNKTKDFSNIPHLGIGNHLLYIKSKEDNLYFLKLFKQSYVEKIN